MRYVGIENSVFKVRMVKLAPRVGKKVKISLPCITADDCKRHFEILELFDHGKLTNVRDIKQTLYYKFNRRHLGRSRPEIWHKIKKFKRLYRSISKKGYNYKRGYMVLTQDGVRLDGSHRGAIIEHLGYKDIVVLVVRWRDYFKKKHLKELYKHINEQKRKYGCLE